MHWTWERYGERAHGRCGHYRIEIYEDGRYSVFYRFQCVGIGEVAPFDVHGGKARAERIAIEHMKKREVDDINAMQAAHKELIGINNSIRKALNIQQHNASIAYELDGGIAVSDLARRVRLDPASATRKQVEDRIDALMREPTELVKKERELRQEAECRLIEERIMKERIIDKVSDLKIRCHNQAIQIGEMAEDIRRLRKTAK